MTLHWDSCNLKPELHKLKHVFVVGIFVLYIWYCCKDFYSTSFGCWCCCCNLVFSFGSHADCVARVEGTHQPIDSCSIFVSTDFFPDYEMNGINTNKKTHKIVCYWTSHWNLLTEGQFKSTNWQCVLCYTNLLPNGDRFTSNEIAFLYIK